MKKFALAITALAFLSAPALADTIHTDGPTNPAKTFDRPVTTPAGAEEFAATIKPASQSTKKRNFGGPISVTKADLHR